MAKDKKTNVNKEPAFSEITKKFKANPVLYIGSVLILLLVVVTFIGGDLLAGGGFGHGDFDLTFGVFDSVPIVYSHENRFGQVHEQLARQHRDTMEATDFRLWWAAFQEAAVHTAAIREMQRSNFKISQGRINRETAMLPHFQQNGQFSVALWRQMPEARRSVLVRQVRENLTVIQFFNDLNTLLVSENEAAFIGNMAADTRTFDMVSFLVDDFPEYEYMAFARENADLFGTIHLSRILITANEREAARVLESVRSGEIAFEDAARAQSQDFIAERGGDMGIRFAHELERDIPALEDRQRIFALNRGDISDLIRVDNNWVIYRIEGEFMEPDLENEHIRESIRSYMRSFQRGRMEDWAIEQAREFARDAELYGFANAANARGRQIFNAGPLPLNFGSIDLFLSLEAFNIIDLPQPQVREMSRNPHFWRTVFSTPVNTPSQPVVHGGNVFVFFPVEQEELPIDVAEHTIEVYPDWIIHALEMSLPQYFLNHPRMENRFWDTYQRLFPFN